MSTVVAHLLVCLFAIYISLTVKCLSKFFAHFKIVLLGILLNFESSLCILDVSPYQINDLHFPPSPFMACFFIVSTLSFKDHKF